MELAILASLLVGLHVYLYYMRAVFFYRKPKPYLSISEYQLLSPVEGTVMYINHNYYREGDIPLADKAGRKTNLNKITVSGEYIHIGIYMSPYNNHHILMPSPGYLGKCWLRGELGSMITDDLWGPRLRKKETWLHEKLHQFIAYNAKVAFSFRDFDMYMIFDKYVAKLSDRNPGARRECLGFVHRGSQMDLIIPADLYEILVKRGDTVTFDTRLGIKR